MQGKHWAGIVVGVMGLVAAQAATPARDVLIDARNVHPESITSDARGALYTGSMAGIIYRALPGEAKATPFIRPDATNGLQAVFGVLADDRSNRLYACTVTNPFAPRAAGAPPPPPSELVAFELRTGRLVARWPLPAPGGVCNDIAVGPDGGVYASDTPGGRILKLAADGKSLAVVAQADGLKGIDGIAFASDGTLYVNIVTTGQMLRVVLGAQPAAVALTPLQLDSSLGGPDGLRLVAGHRFVQAEGTSGRITSVTIEGDRARVRVLREGLISSPGVTVVGKTVYAIEGKINYLADPKLKGQDPGEFKIWAIALD